MLFFNSLTKYNIKKLLLVMIILLLTGCSAEYNLNFDNGIFHDNIKIGKISLDEYSNYKTAEIKAVNVDFGNYLYQTSYDNQFFNLEHTYSFDNYGLSYVLNNCFEMGGVAYDDKYYYIETYGDFKCLTYDNHKVDKVKVNFTSTYKIHEANADYEKNGVYTWVYSEKNKDKPISLKLDKKKIVKVKDNVLDSKKSIHRRIIIFTIVVAICFGIIFSVSRFAGNRDD